MHRNVSTLSAAKADVIETCYNRDERPVPTTPEIMKRVAGLKTQGPLALDAMLDTLMKTKKQPKKSQP